jgi:hypothetical protein
MITKPLDQVTAADVADLCAQGGAYEGLTLEFKRELPGRDGRPDPWLAGGDFTAYARDHLFREIVAFANAQGGTLALGIDETHDRPPRAAAVMPIPRVHDLAARLEDAARACIEPPLGSLHVQGVVTDGADAGGVLFRTVASPFGPHRVASGGHAFIRRGSSSVQMTMREIQDLTLDLARGADRLERVFSGRASAFNDWLRSSPTEHGDFRVTAAPLGPLPQLVRISDQPEVPFRAAHRVLWDGAAEQVLELPMRAYRTRPILRGERRSSNDEEHFAFQLDVLDSGVVDFWFRGLFAPKQQIHLRIGAMLGAYLGVLQLTDWLRGLAGAPEWEFAVELELTGLPADTHPRQIERVPLRSLVIHVFGGTIRVPDAPLVFPRLVTRSRADHETIMNQVCRDLIDAAGLRAGPARMTLRP